MRSGIDVSIVLPAYNEQKIIRHSLAQLAAFVHRYHRDLGTTEVIVVAAGTDRTAALARHFAGSFDAFRVLTPATRVGKGRDVRLGMQAARGEVRLFVDADLSTPLKHILTLVALLRDGQADVVIGVRQLSRIHPSVFRSLLSVASNIVIRSLLLPGLHDTQCGFKGFTAAAARWLFARQAVQGWGFDMELLRYAHEHHLRVTQLPIPDWHETRDESLRGEPLSAAALRTLRELGAVRLHAWERSLRRFWYIWVLAAGVSVFGLSMWLGHQQSVWFDEAYSILLTKQSYGQLLHLTAVDVHPPFYYLALKAWTRWFGLSETALRSFSALCGAAAASIGLVFVRWRFGLRAMLVTTPVLILAPYALRYDFEIRMYALASLIGIAATAVLVRATESLGRTRLAWWAGYGALVAVGLYTLYYTALIWLAHLAWILYMSRRLASWRLLRNWLAAIGLSIALYAPWLPVFFDQMRHSTLNGLTHPMTWQSLLGIFSFLFSFQASWQLSRGELAIIILAAAAAVYLVVQALRHAGNMQPSLLLLLCCFIVPFIVLAVGSLPPLRPLFMMRYTAHVVIAGYLLLGVSLAIGLRARIRGAALGLGGLLLLLATGVANLHHTGNFIYEQLKRPQMRHIAADIPACTPDSTAIAGNPYLFVEMAYYLPDCQLLFFRDKLTSSRGGYAALYKSPQQYSRGKPLRSATVYAVYSPKQPIPLPANFKAISSRDYQFLRLTVYKRNPQPPPIISGTTPR